LDDKGEAYLAGDGNLLQVFARLTLRVRDPYAYHLKSNVTAQGFQFDDVINARVEREDAIQNAEGYRNKKVPEARSEATRIRTRASAERQARELAAEGEASRFLARLDAVREVGRVGVLQIYLEFVTKVGRSLGLIRVVTPGDRRL
jgi:regulator of protease activity HflC (stomatin/prohibitin superfamily)